MILERTVARKSRDTGAKALVPRIAVAYSFVLGATLEITLNGERREVPAPLSVAELLVQLGLKPEYVAVEVNNDLVGRGSHSARLLAPGDVLEVVTLVGGGQRRHTVESFLRSRSAPTRSGAGCSSGRASTPRLS